MPNANSALLTATRFTVLDNNGNPVSGAKVHTYVAGSVATPQATYSDPDLTVLNANPTVADTAGRLTMWLQNLPYKIVVNDASDALLYSIDNYAAQFGIWTAYTPALTNLTLGNGTMTAFYSASGKTVRFWFQIVLGSSSSMGSDPTIGLPLTMDTTLAGLTGLVMGTGQAVDTGTASYALLLRIRASTSISPCLVVTNATYATFDLLTATVPFTWGSTDVLMGFGSYQSV